jgi:hypothetical protein
MKGIKPVCTIYPNPPNPLHPLYHSPLEKNTTDMVRPIELAHKLLVRGHSLFQV